MPKIKVSLSDIDFEILNTLSTDEGKSGSEIAEEIELSESALSKQITKLRGIGLLLRHRDEDEGLLIYLTSKGEKVLNQRKSEENPNSKEVNKKMAKLSFQIDDDIGEDIREIAESENQSVSEFLSELVCDALDEFYPETDEGEETEELEENG